ncbi:MAG: hypothetical protein ABL921_24890 [Pirellula sp.]
MRNYLTFFILLATCGVVLGPIAVELVGPKSKARWLLAQAANDYESGATEASQENLDRAASISPEIVIDPEFWKLRFELVFAKNRPHEEMVSRLYEDAKNMIPTLPPKSRSAVAESVAARFKHHKRLEIAIGVLEACLPPIELRSPLENNDIAYFRALAKTDLHIALKEIDTAIQSSRSPEVLDTKAWILHRLGRNNHAIDWANESIRRTYDQLKLAARDAKWQEIVELLESNGHESTKKSDGSAIDTKSTPPEKDSPNNPSTADSKNNLNVEIQLGNPLDQIKAKYPTIDATRIGAIARNLAVMRFHRACILDELDRVDESELDYVWLDKFGFSKTHELD